MTKPFHLIPGPRGLPLVGSALDYSRFGRYSFERLHYVKREKRHLYGRLYREKLGPGVYMVNVFDPEDAERVYRADGRYPARPPLPITIAAYKKDGLPLGLGSKNGEDWYKLRKPVQKLMMHPRAAALYLPAQNAVADDFLHRLEELVDVNGRVPDFTNVLLRYTMESIATVCFDARLGCLHREIDEGSEAEQVMTSTTAMFEAVQNTMFSFPWFLFFRTALYRQYIRSKKICDSIALNHIQRAVARTQCPGQCPNTSASGERAPHFLQTLVTSKLLTADEVVGLTTDLFIAGIDSTANALSFAIYNLARNMDKQDRLSAEIDTVLPPGEPVTPSAIDRLSYLKACVKESFRLNFPVEGGTMRTLQRDVVLGGYRVPAGVNVVLNNQTMCLEEQYFPEPRRYLPERWLNDGDTNLKRPPPFVMLPFGHGARMCIGRRFAEQEIYLALIKMVQRFRMSYEGEPIGMMNRLFTVPDRPVDVTLQPRKRDRI